MWSIRIVVKIRVSRKLKINRCEDFTQLATDGKQIGSSFTLLHDFLPPPPPVFLLSRLNVSTITLLSLMHFIIMS
jgi:hypothetical protein